MEDFPEEMLSPDAPYQSILYSDELHPISKKNQMEFFEKIYSEMLKKNRKFHSEYWQGKDDVRFYNGLLDELAIENQRAITYPRITDKILLILILFAMVYNSGPEPNANVLVFLSVFLFCFIFYLVIREPLEMCHRTCPTLELKRFYRKLDTFITMKPTHQEEQLGYQKLKFRIIACLENQYCGVNLIVLMFDIFINCAMIVLSILILWVRVGNEHKEFLPDPILHIITCAVSISFTLIYFNVCYKNWKWLEKFKSELIVKKFI